MTTIILVAGATGNLGGRIVKALVKNKAQVRALVRKSSKSNQIEALRSLGVDVFLIEDWNKYNIKEACKDVSCAISALSGLKEVIIDAQKPLLEGLVMANVPRFIPSDFSIDFTNLIPGRNRNLDLRREFHKYLNETPIAATSIFNGAFMDMLTGQMPMILFKIKRILFWGNADTVMDFTTIDNTAEYTARVALDESSPRFLHIAGDSLSPRALKEIMTRISGEKYRFLRPGGIGLLNLMISAGKILTPGKNNIYPSWQGMQYMRDMLEGRVKIYHHDNNRFPDIHWTQTRDLLSEYLKKLNKG